MTLKRIEVHYGGDEYTISNRELSEVQAEIEAITASGQTGWLRVNYGQGSVQLALLAITAGTPIALMPEPSEDSSN